MSSKAKIPFKFGRTGRTRCRTTSPFAGLLMDLSSSLDSEAVASFKLVLQVDRLITKKELCKVKHPADIFSQLEKAGIISSDDMSFVEHIMVKIGRRDLESMIKDYYQRQIEKDQTVLKCVTSSMTAVKNHAVEISPLNRMGPDGDSTLTNSQGSAMSVTDDEKLEYNQDKLACLDIDDTDAIMASQ